MRKVKVILTVLAMILLSGFAAGQLSAEGRTSRDVQKELFEARKDVSYIEKRDNLDTEAMRKVKALEAEYEELKAKEAAELRERVIHGYSERLAELYDTQVAVSNEYFEKNAKLNSLLNTIKIKKDFGKDTAELEAEVENLKPVVGDLKTRYEVAKAAYQEQRHAERLQKYGERFAEAR